MEYCIRMINAKKELCKMILLLCLCLVPLSSLAAKAGEYTDTKVFTVQMANVPVKDVLNYVEKNSKFIFFYANGTLDLKRKVSVNVSNKPIMTLLDQVFKGSDVKYDIDGYQISLKKVAGKTENPTEYAVKKRKVTGVVVDASNDEPLIGAPVYFDNKTNGVVTDIDGFFQ